MRTEPFTVDDVINVLATTDLTRKNRRTEDGDCRYSVEYEVACIAAHVIRELDSPMFAFIAASHNNQMVNRLPSFVLRNFDPNAIELLARAQMAADDSAKDLTWKQALEEIGWTVTSAQTTDDTIEVCKALIADAQEGRRTMDDAMNRIEDALYARHGGWYISFTGTDDGIRNPLPE